MERLTLEEPPGSERPAVEETVLQKCQAGVLRAGRGEPAGTREQRGDAPLVDGEQEDGEAGQEALSRARSPLKRRSSSARKVAKSAPPASGFRCTTRSIAGRLPRRVHRR